MSDPTWEGWTNQATWFVAFQIQNNFEHEQAVKKLAQNNKGKIDPYELATYCSNRIEPLDETMAISRGKGIVLEEICEHLEIQFADAGMIPAKEKEVKIEDTGVLAVISGMTVEDNVIKLASGKLDRNMYVKVDKILQAMGGKWNKKTGGHLFDENPEGLLDYLMLHGEPPKTAKPQKFGEFFTPEKLAIKVVYLVGLYPGEMVLEPSAGHGALAILASKVVGIGNVKCIEIQKKNAKVLEKAGFYVKQIDFMAQEGRAVFPKIVMNPPFEKQADIDHVMHAYNDFLKPGGKLVAIMSASVKWRENKKSIAFRELLESIGGTIDTNAEGAFKSSGTMVNTVIVVMDKPE